MIFWFKPKKMQVEKSRSTSPLERAAEFSPGREPGVSVVETNGAPGGATETSTLTRLPAAFLSPSPRAH